jgi:hypothetical protein
MNGKSETYDNMGLKSLIKQQYPQCTHRVVTLVNKGIQELSIITPHYGLLTLLEVRTSVKIREGN